MIRVHVRENLKMFTRYTGSFGTLDEVSKTVLPEAEGVSSRMVNSYTSKSCYVYDYVVNQQGRPEKHIKVSCWRSRSMVRLRTKAIEVKYLHRASCVRSGHMPFWTGTAYRPCRYPVRSPSAPYPLVVYARCRLTPNEFGALPTRRRSATTNTLMIQAAASRVARTAPYIFSFFFPLWRVLPDRRSGRSFLRKGSWRQ